MQHVRATTAKSEGKGVGEERHVAESRDVRRCEEMVTRRCERVERFRCI